MILFSKKSLLAVVVAVLGSIPQTQALSVPAQYALVLNIELQMMPMLMIPAWEVDEQDDALIVTLHDVEAVNSVLFDVAHESLTLTSPQAVWEMSMAEGSEGYALAIYFIQQDFMMDNDEEEMSSVSFENIGLDASYDFSEASVEYDEDASAVTITAPLSDRKTEAHGTVPAVEEPLIKSDAPMHEEKKEEKGAVEQKEAVVVNEKETLAK